MTDSGHIKFQLFNVLTRRLLPSHRQASTIAAVDRQAGSLGEGEDGGNLGWVFGHHDHSTHYVNDDGEVVPFGEFAEQLALPEPDEGEAND